MRPCYVRLVARGQRGRKGPNVGEKTLEQI
jgi:hypothetical protein